MVCIPAVFVAEALGGGSFALVGGGLVGGGGSERGYPRRNAGGWPPGAEVGGDGAQQDVDVDEEADGPNQNLELEGGCFCWCWCWCWWCSGRGFVGRWHF